ncbi:hypothetical protein Patl1_08036 [Pistacia atlantica]|uniref:Uncharacterized protein n=1 Tax=Pistacia atlantica TaxID=434234 RepID=A0ACC1AL93_9ROSI|nr:hypothetical protein Patl1_08036 [Pistacia atlantica]
MSTSYQRKKTAALVVEGDNYRSLLQGEEEKNTKWRFGTLPNYNTINKLFEEGRTVGNGNDQQDFVSKTSRKLIQTRKKAQTIEDISKLDGGYILAWQTSLPKELSFYNTMHDETASSYMQTFATIFPRGFALEVLQVYSGPPVIAYKFRHGVT